MILSESDLEGVVLELSRGGKGPGGVDQLVDRFLRQQKLIGHYVASYGKELGVEGIGRIILHAAVIARALERASKRPLAQLTAPELDRASARAKKGLPDGA